MKSLSSGSRRRRRQSQAFSVCRVSNIFIFAFRCFFLKSFTTMDLAASTTSATSGALRPTLPFAFLAPSSRKRSLFSSFLEEKKEENAYFPSVSPSVPLSDSTVCLSKIYDDEWGNSYGEKAFSESSIPKEKSFRHKLGLDDGDGQTSRQWNLPWIVGHRGCLYEELENTRAGFQKCAQWGVDAAELDVFVLKCGTLVVFHGGGTDEHPGLLEEYCGVPGSILDYTYQEASERLKFNPDHPEFGCSKEAVRRGSIPTLEEVLLDAKDSGLEIKIELKGEGTVKPTIELVERLDMIDQVSYSSFDLGRLKDLRDLRPDRSQYPTGALFSEVPPDYIQQALNCGATEVHLQYDTCSRQRVQEIHAAGLNSMCWLRGPIGMASDCQDKYWDVGNEDISMYQALMETGVQQMCVNRPDLLVAFRQKKREQQSLEEQVVQIKDEFYGVWNRQ